MTTNCRSLPLCVDVDETLIRTDLSIESLIGTLKSSPWLLFLMPIWLLQGKSVLKAQLARRADIDVTVLPYHTDVLRMIEEASAQGRTTALVTGSNQRYAREIQGHLHLFDQIYASDERLNLTGERKAALLVEQFGEGGYEYVANSRVDMPIWERAGQVVTVNAPKSLQMAVARLGKPHRNIDKTPVSVKSWMKAIRIHQWAKNALLFVPLLTAHRLLDPTGRAKAGP